MKIAVAGTGYVGLSIATLLAQHNEVIAVDVIPEKVEKINNRISPIQDDYIEKFFAEKELNFDIDSLESAFAPAKRIFRNVCEKAYYRIEYLCDTYTPIENIKQLSDELTEYLVGGV